LLLLQQLRLQTKKVGVIVMKKYIMPSLSEHKITTEIATSDIVSVVENFVDFGGTGWGGLTPEDVN